MPASYSQPLLGRALYHCPAACFNSLKVAGLAPDFSAMSHPSTLGALLEP